MQVTWQTIITAGAVLAALCTLTGMLFRIFGWYQHDHERDRSMRALKERHERDLKRVKEENSLICYALSACLDGLMQLGANHTVPDAKERLDKYLNEQAHK